MIRRLFSSVARDERRLVLAQPSGIAVSDREQIASLHRQLAAKDATIGRLTDQLLAAPKVPTGDRHCPNFAGLEQTVRLLQDERRDLRKQLARHELTS